MAIVKGVIFNNKESFDGIIGAVYNHFKAKYPENIATSWSSGIEAKDSSGEVLLIVDERVLDFPWNPHAVVDIDTNDEKWFNNDTV